MSKNTQNLMSRTLKSRSHTSYRDIPTVSQSTANQR